MTNNKFRSETFVKFPGKYFQMDIDGDSKLEKPVQDLMKLINQSDAQKNPEKTITGTLVGMSTKQISAALKVLQNISDLIRIEHESSQKIVGASNHFYTLLSQCWSASSPIVINSDFAVKYWSHRLKSTLKTIQNQFNPDEYYLKLNCDIRPIDKKSEEFDLLKRCFDNTSTHSSFTLTIEEIFKVKRLDGEACFEPFKDFKRHLLWHGSDIRHFNGILSNGLKVQPAEARHSDNGWFGKGIYFADIAFNSFRFSWCHKHTNKTGLMLLCEVALGDSCILWNPENVKKLPAGKSSVKAVGRIYPEGIHTFSDGATINTGDKIGIKTEFSMPYNEYVVYDPAQVKIRYLFRYKWNAVAKKMN